MYTKKILFFFFMSMRMIEELVKICPNFESADLQENNIEEKKMGLALNLLFTCEYCK